MSGGSILWVEAVVGGGDERGKWAWEVNIGGGNERWMWGWASRGDDNCMLWPSQRAAR